MTNQLAGVIVAIVEFSTGKEGVLMTGRFQRFSYAMAEIYRCWHKIAAAEMQAFGLKGPHCVYLTAMGSFPNGVTPGELCELLGRDKADVSRTLAALESRGLVERQPGVSARRVAYRLTGEGARAATAVQRRADLAVELAGRDLGDGDRQVFYRALEAICPRVASVSPLAR